VAVRKEWPGFGLKERRRYRRCRKSAEIEDQHLLGGIQLDLERNELDGIAVNSWWNTGSY
jgi:hypothetical protein